jgi:predicted N-acyltransferase
VGDPDFHEAVADFLARETHHVDAYMDELDEHVPYRDDALPPIPAP